MDKATLPQQLLDHTPWEASANPIWLASAFQLFRNLAQYRFPSKMDSQEMLQARNMMKEAFVQEKSLDHPLFLGAEELSPLDREFLFEHFLCPESFQNSVAGQGFVVDLSGRFLALLNIEDHLQLQYVDCLGAWDQTYHQLFQLESSLENRLHFAFHSRFGYLSSDPSLSGTACLVSVYLHIPGLIHTKQFEELLLKQEEGEIEVTSIEHTQQEFVGDLLVLRNRFTLGISEDSILHSLNTAAMKWMAAEKEVRLHLKKEDAVQLKDEISRAYGLLCHSYQLSTKEALGALSLIKLGLDLGWIKDVLDKKINELFFTCRRAHLLRILKETALDPQELARKRAEFLHAQLQGMRLNY